MTSLNNAGSNPDYFEVDHDTNACCWSWNDVAQFRTSAQFLGYAFAYIFGSPVPPGQTWQHSATGMGTACKQSGIVPDLYTFESWESNLQPSVTVPETTQSTFMATVYGFRLSGLFPF